MADFEQRFGTLDADTGLYQFSAIRQGTMVGLLCVGALLGSLAGGRAADVLGRRLAISVSAVASCAGTAIEISSQTAWAQFAVGRMVTGLGIGALSVAVPMYQSESAPAQLRGVLVSLYQLLITLGIWTAEMVNYGAHASLPGSAAWRVPEGLGFLWALLLGVGVLFLPESPRFAFRRGREAEARATVAALAGLDEASPAVAAELDEMRAKLAEERAAAADAGRWYEMFTGPRMLYRTLLGMALQAGQQLTGANFFFYYGTTVFGASGLTDGYVTQIVLGSVNVACTVAGLWVVARCGRRPALVAGAVVMAACFVVYAAVGHAAITPHAAAGTRPPAFAGPALVACSCVFIAAFATTWGPLVWAVVAEMYPARHRAPCMALATASNWLCNFLMSLLTRFATDAVGYLYGLVFAGCCAAAAALVFFLVVESKDRSLEEIDTMYVTRVSPVGSARWGRDENQARQRRVPA